MRPELTEDQLKRINVKTIQPIVQPPKYDLDSEHLVLIMGVKALVRIFKREARFDYDKGARTMQYFYWFKSVRKEDVIWDNVPEDSLREMIYDGSK